MLSENESPFWVYILISIFLHLLVYVIFYFGLPSFKRAPKDEAMTFEVIQVKDKSNIKTKKVQKKKPGSKSKKQAKALQKTQPKNPAPQKKSAPKPQKSTPKKTAPKPAVKNQQAGKLLKNLENKSMDKKSDAKQDAKGKRHEKSPMSIGEIDYIRQKVAQNWNMPIGIKDAGAITVKLYIALNPNGGIQDVKLESKQCPLGSDLACKAAIDSAIRAVHQSAPYDKLRPDRYETWAEFQFNFDPKDALM